MRGEEGREQGGVSCCVRAVQLLGSISEMSLRSLASQADILRQGWSLRRTKPRSLQDGREAPLHRYVIIVFHSSLFSFSVFDTSYVFFWWLVFTHCVDEHSNI